MQSLVQESKPNNNIVCTAATNKTETTPHHQSSLTGVSIYVYILFNSMSALAKTQKAKALDLVAQAEATATKKGWFGGVKERNLEDACELYMQAANAYKVGGLAHEAGTVYVTTGGIYRDKLNQVSEAAKCFSQAGAWRFLHRVACFATVTFLLNR